MFISLISWALYFCQLAGKKEKTKQNSGTLRPCWLMVKHYGPFLKVFIVSQNNYIKPQVLYNNLIQFSCAVILNSVLSLVDLR